jgi:hypothetical protein
MKSLPIIIIFTFAFIASANSAQFQSLADKVNYYKQRYKVECANEKITDNYGNGFDSLYGTRNMKTILYGIAYRGGANNFYHKTNKRDNQNPLPNDGLQHLCNEGFSEAIYLYGKRFADAKKIFTNDNDTLRYIQNSAMNRKTQKELLTMVKARIDYPQLGPMYLHCWNGWHQSGYVASIILMQFCDYTNKQARKYWEQNTDGAYKKFNTVKNMISNFEPFPELKIDATTQSLICPCEKR